MRLTQAQLEAPKVWFFGTWGKWLVAEPSGSVNPLNSSWNSQG